MVLSILLSSLASAEVPVAAGEMLGNAYTLPASKMRLQIVAPSSYGITDELEIKSSLLGLFGGPNVQVEYGLMREGDRALSLSAGASTFWGGGYLGASVGGLYTLGGESENRLSFGGNLGFATTSGVASVSLPLSVSYELVTSPQTVWSFFGEADPLSLANSSTAGTGAGFSWTHGWEYYRLTLGAIFADTSEINASLETAGLDPLSSSILPLPYVLMWWTL